MSSVALKEICDVGENNPDDVIVMSAGLSWLGLGYYKLLPESLCYNLEG